LRFRFYVPQVFLRAKKIFLGKKGLKPGKFNFNMEEAKEKKINKMRSTVISFLKNTSS